MAQYIGQAPINGFHAKQSLTGDGSTTSFTLDQTVASETAIIVSVGGVLQEPGVAYNLTVGGTKIDFTEAPASTDTVYIQFLGKAVVQNLQDVNGSEFVLDLDGDTSFTADTDDEIDIRVGGSDISTIKSTGYHNLDSIKYVAGTGDDLQLYHDGTNSFLTNSTGALKIATETSGIAITIGHSTSEVTIADNATVAGNLTVTGTLTQTGTQTFDGGLDVDNFSLNGTTLSLSSGDMTVDVAGDIILDADGGDIFFKDGGTTFGSATNTSGNLIIKSGTTTALTFSGANVTAAGTITGNLTGDVTGDVTGNVSGTAATVTGAAQSNITSLGTLTTLTVDDITINGSTISDSGAFDIDVGGNITIDADGGTITFADGGSSLGTITSSGYSGTAAVATTVTITDNESTDENNAIIFTAGGDTDGGNLGLESDGDLTYNPSTGTLSVTNIVTSGTHTVTNSVTMNANNAVVFEGATADAYETTLTSVDATGSDKSISLPNVSGTLPVLAAASTTQITTTPEEINLIDGGTARGTTAVASGDGILINDGGTMRMTNVDTVSTYFSSHNVGGSNIVTTGALDSGSITSGFGAIDNGTSGIRTATFTAETAFVPDAADGATLGTSSLEFSDLYLADESVIYFGDDQEVSLIHDHNDGLILKNNLTADGSAAVFHLQTGETDIAQDDVLGTIRFSAPDEGTGTDAITVAAEILAISEGDFSSSSNATKLDFRTGSSEAATSKMTLSSAGVLDVDGGITIDNITIDGTTIALSSGNLILDSAADIFLDAGGADIVFKDDGTQIGLFTMDSSNLTLQSSVSDKDLIFKGNDGGSTITALTLDMSAAGAATFNNDVTAFSDARLKENVETIDNALDKVCAMRGVTFDRIDSTESGRQMGVIAQEIQDIVPEVVKVNNDEDNTLSVSYGNLVGVLIESIKELKAEIDELKGN